MKLEMFTIPPTRARGVARGASLAAVAVLIAAGLTGCASQNLHAQRVQAFAQAGANYAEALPAVLDESFRSTVEVDSLELMTHRAPLTESDRLDAYARHNDVLDERQEILRDVARHTALLRSYFLSLSALAAVDSENSGLLEATNGLVAELGAVGVDLAGQSIGGTTVGELVPGATELVLGAYKSRVLHRELERNGATVERELRLQQVLLQALAEAMEGELEARREAELTALGLEFARDPSKLAFKDFAARRLAALRASGRAAAVSDAARASESLSRSFAALVEGRFDEANLRALLTDVGSVMTTLRSITEPGG